MAIMEDKENAAPLDSATAFDLPILQATKKGRSKSMGPGGNGAVSPVKKSCFDRRRSAYTPAVKGIIPDKEDAERKAARRKSMANRRVSFAPEATLHTWDVIDHLRDHTNSTNSSDALRRSPRLSPSRQDSSPFSPEPSEELEYGSEDSEDDGEEDVESLEEATGTGMSFNAEDRTGMTAASNSSSTSSSAQLERNLRMAAEAAGTRGIEYDEFGDMSMEMAEDEITNAFQPWAERGTEVHHGLAALDQENVDPFRGAEKLQAVTPMSQLPNVQHSDNTNVSMDMTHAIGKVLQTNAIAALSSPPTAEATMDFTSVVRSANHMTETYADKTVALASNKRSAAAIDEIANSQESPSTSSKRRRSTKSSIFARKSLEQPGQAANVGILEDQDETMQSTPVAGGIKAPSRMSFTSIDENEDMSMELTTVLGGIRADHSIEQSQLRASSPQKPLPVGSASTPEDNESTPTPQRTVNLNAAAPTTKSPTSQDKSDLQSSKAGGSLSPGRRTSARLSRLVPTPGKPGVSLDQSGQAVISPDARLHTPRSPGATTASGNVDPAAKNSTARQLLASPKSPEALQSSPFHSVAASPVSVRKTRHQQAMRETTPPVLMPHKAGYDITDSLKIMSTPRKETLKTLSPKKRTPSPTKSRRSPRRTPSRMDSPVNNVQEQEPGKTHNTDSLSFHLQTFLDEAGIRFMDLTTSKRRATIAPTPSRIRKLSGNSEAYAEESIALDDAIISAACTEPELELYKHACNELRKYIDGGKADIKTLEESTLADTPELIQSYMTGTPEYRSMIDAHLRDVKVHARLRSKEMWYSWRSNLVDDLMKVLQSIAEGLLNDDDILQEKEKTLSKALPLLLEKRTALQTEADVLQASIDSVPAEQKEELDEVRLELQSIATSLDEKRRMARELQLQLAGRETQLNELNKRKGRCIKVIQDADHIKAVSQISTAQGIADLQTSINKLESMSGWKLVASTANPPTATMSYKSELEFFFEPLAFMASDGDASEIGHSSLSLRYTGNVPAMPTCERFFLQLLRAHLHTVSQGSIPINAVFSMISKTWDMAQAVAEASRCMSIECPTKASIHSDERLQIASSILVPETQSKVAAVINVLVVLRSDREIDFVVGSDVNLVYGNASNQAAARKQFSESTATGPIGWQAALQELRDTLQTTSKKAKAVK